MQAEFQTELIDWENKLIVCLFCFVFKQHVAFFCDSVKLWKAEQGNKEKHTKVKNLVRKFIVSFQELKWVLRVVGCVA